MSMTLSDLAKQLKKARPIVKKDEQKDKPKNKSKDVKVQLIYAFNGTGKTRLSGEFEKLVTPKSGDEEDNIRYLYYNAFIEELFYWENDAKFKLKIRPNKFINWIFGEEGQDQNVIGHFQSYTDEKLNPKFNEPYSIKVDNKNIVIPAFSEVTFSYKGGNVGDSDNTKKSENIKISKGEESCFIWSVFYTILKQAKEVLNIDTDSIDQERWTDYFDDLEYVFIDDPVTSLDENHLIKLAVDLAELIKSSKSNLKFIITTHNPLFYNVLSNQFKGQNDETGYNHRKHFKKYSLRKTENSTYELEESTDSPFSYHLFLLKELDTAVENNQIHKYHFNFLRNILEKTATFLGKKNWGELLPKTGDGKTDAYASRIINFSSHSDHSDEEVAELREPDKQVLKYVLTHFKNKYHF